MFHSVKYCLKSTFPHETVTAIGLIKYVIVPEYFNASFKSTLLERMSCEMTPAS